MAFSSTDLASIDAAIASGELRVQIDNREVIYRSIDDLMKARRVILEELGTTAAAPRRAYRFTFDTQRG